MKRLIVSILIVVAAFVARSQDPNYSQFFMNDMYYNPAMTGINDGLRVGATYRNLWSPIPSKFNTGTVSVDGAGVNKMGLGLIVSQDVEGEGKLKTTTAGGNYSYRVLETRNLRFQLGVNGQYVRKEIDWSQFVFSDQLDEVFGDVNSSAFISPAGNVEHYVDFGAGGAVMFNAGRGSGANGRKLTAIVGASVLHLAQPADAFIGGQQAFLPRKIVVHGLCKIAMPTVNIRPGFIFEKQSTLSTFQLGSNFSKESMFAGIWVRNRKFTMSPNSYDSFIFNLGFFKSTANNTKFRLGYSYDFTISRLRTSSFGTHEITLLIEWTDSFLFAGIAKRKAQKKKTRFIPCLDY